MKPGEDPRRERQLALYLTAEHACSYLEGLNARTLFVDPLARMDGQTYQALVDQGFRRSGAHVYRPACRGCARCVPVRIPIDEFRPDRSQRRAWNRNFGDIRVCDSAATFRASHFALYLRYLSARHADGSMAEDRTVESYRRFLLDPWGGDTRLLELRIGERLLGVAVTDILPRGLSAVYTFYDPDLSERALGTFAILTQIQVARRLNLPFLYLGYWIGGCRKMQYKERFRPIECWDGRRWHRREHGEAMCPG